MTASPEFPNALLAYFFRSCVVFYNAKPWKLLGEIDNVRINVETDQPIFANVTGAAKTIPPGLSLISAFDSVEALNREVEPEQRWTDIAFSGAQLLVMFLPEPEVPQWLRDARRLNKWPLASSAAFPAFGATEPDGTMRDLSEDELRALCVAMNVVTTFVATKRKLIEARVPFSEVVTVRDDGGAVKIALVLFPFDPDAEDGWQSYKQYHGNDSSANPALQEVRNAALDLPDVSATLDRLVWSFFQDFDPNYLPDEAEWDDAMMRFLAWAIFGFRADGRTLAERALLQLGETKSSAELEVHRRVVQARSGMFRVVSVKRDVGMQLYDVELGDTLDVVERIGTRGLKPGHGLVGMLHPISDTGWVLSPGAVMYPSIPDEPRSEGDDLSAEHFAPIFEASVLGASLEWIRELDAEALPDSYELFADAVRATGDEMPSYEELQAEIMNTEQPAQLAEKFGGRAWWTETEMEAMLAFLMLAWNATPRAELGGKTPDAVFHEQERVRAVRPVGGRRRR